MTDSKKLSADDSEQFILPNGEVLTREQMEATLKTKAECYLDLGRLSEQDDNYEDAVRYYSLAFTMPAGSDRTWYFLNSNLGYSLNRLERYAEAETSCRRAIAINPFQYNAHKNLGLSLRGHGR
jgi:tetratricopeptide (TPR) repeat protein